MRQNKIDYKKAVATIQICEQVSQDDWQKPPRSPQCVKWRLLNALKEELLEPDAELIVIK